MTSRLPLPPAEVVELADDLLADERALTDWEREFARRMREIGQAGLPLSILQSDKLREIVARVGLPRGLTASEDALWD